MSSKSYQQYRSELTLDSVIQQNYQAFSAIPDPRNRVIGQMLPDICQAGFALFHLKFPSLLDFDSQTIVQRQNLRSVYGLQQVCSDTQLRRMLDQVAPHYFHRRITQLIQHDFARVGGARQFQVLDGRLILSLDGVEHFRSTRIHCGACLTRDSTKTGRSYHHQMLCGSIVHPHESTVFVAVAEPIIQQDGSQKNDCERSAARRVIDTVSKVYRNYKFLVVADGLYSCGSLVRQLTEAGHDFIITAKPGDHQALFKHFETWSVRGATSKLTRREGRTTHRFEWATGLSLNGSWAQMRLNVLHYEEEIEGSSGRKLRFTWVTNRAINRNNVMELMRIGRSRWKIENETFNTLKNQGYQFEHNYGHGEQHLATGLAYLMLLAFLVDQLMELCSQKFQVILKAARTRVKVWFTQRALFTTQPFEDFSGIYGRLAELFGVQLVGLRVHLTWGTAASTCQSG